MLYDPYWALFASCGTQRDCLTKGVLISLFDCLMWKLRIVVDDETSAGVACIAGLKVPQLGVVNSPPLRNP